MRKIIRLVAKNPRLRPAVNEASSSLESAIKKNAQIQAGLLSESSTVVSGLIKDKQLKVVAAYYDLASGGVTLLD